MYRPEEMLARAILIGVLLAFAAFATIMVWALHDLSVSNVLEPSTEPIIVLEAVDGTELVRKLPARHPPVGRQDIPQHLVDAVLAIEDRRFYEHGGIDPSAILRAAVRNLFAAGIVEGGSTITQQLDQASAGRRGANAQAQDPRGSSGGVAREAP